MSSTSTNVPEQPLGPLGEVDVEEAILQKWEVDDENHLTESDEEANDDLREEETSESDVLEEDSNDQESDEVEEDPVESEDQTEENEEDQPLLADDDSLVEIVIDGKAEQASLKDLKRLYGQEASLTRKSQETSAKRKEADEALERASVNYQKLLERAEAKWKPYSEVDMLVASKQMPDADFAQLRAEARSAEEDLKFLKEESNKFYDGIQQERAKQEQAAAQECIRTLQSDIPDWSNDLYNQIRGYAVNQGLNQAEVDRYTDPNVIKVLHKARLYDESKKTALKKKVNKPPVKVLRSKKSPNTSGAGAKAEKITAAMKKMQKGSTLAATDDDVADLIMARWED